ERPELLFTENETNVERLWNAPSPHPFVKDAFHDFVIAGRRGAVNPAREGTKAAALFRLELGPGASTTLRLRLSERGAAARPGGRIPSAGSARFGRDFDETFRARAAEADEFY